MKRSITLSKRLSAIAALVKPQIPLADIGTDHAFLPVSLLQENRIPTAIAADIAPGPLQNAKRTVLDADLADRISLVLTNGLSGLEACGIGQVVIAGMGGELIARILSEADFIKQKAIFLILQPMTRAEELRTWLAEHGFAITNEVRCKEDDRIYQIFTAVYDGKRRSISRITALLGDTLDQDAPLFKEQRARLYDIYAARLSGKRRAGLPVDEEQEILSRLTEVL